MKQILVSAVFSALAILLIPSQLRPDEPVPAVPEDTVLWIEDAGPETHWKEAASEPETAGLETVRLLDGGTVQLLPADDYLTCVVLSEMPPEFELSEGHYCACWLRHPNAPEIQLTRF